MTPDPASLRNLAQRYGTPRRGVAATPRAWQPFTHRTARSALTAALRRWGGVSSPCKGLYSKVRVISSRRLGRPVVQAFAVRPAALRFCTYELRVRT
jgi:hypothetical protein